jgi:hypothetical protein
MLIFSIISLTGLHMKKSLINFLLFFGLLYAGRVTAQQNESVQVKNDAAKHEVSVSIGNQPFTSFLYSDTLAKPILFPIYAPGNIVVTRGYPLAPRPGESTDHPHHQGLWFNYESVNGLDFWNNSWAIPAEKKHLYGAIKNTQVTSAQGGAKGTLSWTADWVDIQKNVLLKESTTFFFSGNRHQRIIDRITTLTAQQDVAFPDTKDGLLGLRVTKELELPSNGAKQFVDVHGNITTVEPDAAKVANGNYLTSEGKQGDSAWSTRGSWCLLYGKKNNETVSIAILDHPKNPGFPTYWHARGYGLFAANPLGQKVFSNGKENLNFKLEKGQSVTFRYRIIVAAGEKALGTETLNTQEKQFAGQY